MRIALALFITILTGSAFETAKADPYRWCALYGGGRGGGAMNCYFVTLAQCQATVSGIGGFCKENLFYDGKPIVTPEERVQPKKKPN